MSLGSQGLLGPQDACRDYHGIHYCGTLYGKVSTYIMFDWTYVLEEQRKCLHLLCEDPPWRMA